MSAESTLYSLLSTAAGVTALVADRIYPDVIPQDKAVPYLGFERVTTEPINAISGAKLADLVGLTLACWADTRVGAEALADAVVAAIAGSDFTYTGRGVEIDENTGRLAATVDCQILT